MSPTSYGPAMTGYATHRERFVPGVAGAEVREVPWVPETLENAVRAGDFSIARPGALLLTAPRIGRFFVTGGRLIEFVREAGADPLEVEQFLYGSARAALVHQGGGLPLHAACLLPPDKEFAVAISGHSGAGKSTLAKELLERGWHLVGDDVTPLYAGSNAVMAWPSRGGLKLWRDACTRFDIDSTELQPLPGQRDKYILPAATPIDPVRLGYIFLLERGLEGGAAPILGPARLAALAANTFKPNYLAALQCMQSHFQIACQVSAQVKMSSLRWDGPPAEGADLLTAFVAENECPQGGERNLEDSSLQKFPPQAVPSPVSFKPLLKVR